MSLTESIGRRLVGPRLAGIATSFEPLLRHEVVAAAMRAGIEYEALLRMQHEFTRGLVDGVTGRRTDRRRLIERELDARRRLAPHRPHPRRGGPAVFWHGPDRVTGRPVVVLVNGWTASGLLWPAELVAQLEGSFDVVRIDNRGTGYSRTATAPFTLTQLAADVRVVLNAIGARSATVVGLSMGGMIAQELAINHPDVVERLVLCGTRPPTPAAFQPAPSVLAGVVAAPRPGERIDDFILRTWGAVAAPGFVESHPEQMRELVADVRRRPTPRAGVFDQMRAIAAWSGAHRLARITAPTVVLHGADDPLIPVGNGMRLAQLIPGARYVELPAVGHHVSYEAPAAVVDAIGLA